jgi:hypothetical protein
VTRVCTWLDYHIHPSKRYDTYPDSNELTAIRIVHPLLVGHEQIVLQTDSFTPLQSCKIDTRKSKVSSQSTYNKMMGRHVYRFDCTV